MKTTIRSKKYIAKKLFDAILMFCYIFAFKIYNIIDSQIVVLLLIVILFIFSTKIRTTIIRILKQQYIHKILFVSIIILILSVLTTIVNGKYDFTYIKTFIHLLLSLVTGIGVFGYLKATNEQNPNVINLILAAFLVQSLFQWICFFLPHDIIHMFDWAKSSNTIEIMKQYHYRRGLALSSSGFFGLSAGYGIAIILYATKFNTICKRIIPKTMLLCLLVSSTMFVGRTALISLIPFILIIIARIVKKEIKIKQLILALSTIAISATIIITLINNYSKNNIFSWAYEPIINLINKGELSTTSTDTVKKMYENFDYQETNYFIGNGEYTCIDEAKNTEYYCQHVDIGWLRKLRYFGIIGIIGVLFLEISFFGTIKKDYVKISILLFLIILEFKGEQIGIAILSHSIIILYTLYTNDAKVRLKENIDEKK